MTRRRVTLALAAVAAVLVLTGCNLAAKVTVQPDGSGSYSIVMAVPDSSSNSGQALYGVLQKAAATSDFPLTVSRYSANGASGAAMSFHFHSLKDLNAESQRLAASGKGGIGVTVDRDGSGWHFSASTAHGLVNPDGASSIGISSIISVDLIVRLPGAPGQNNAKTVTHTASMSTFTWDLTSAQTATTVQAATTYVGNQANVRLATAVTPVHHGAALSNVSTGLSVGAIIGIVVGVVAIFGTLVAFVLRRRRKTVLRDKAELVSASTTAVQSARN
jgi:hypothetical protein